LPGESGRSSAGCDGTGHDGIFHCRGFHSTSGLVCYKKSPACSSSKFSGSPENDGIINSVHKVQKDFLIFKYSQLAWVSKKSRFTRIAERGNG
jgi:hypothetical protein